MPWTDAEFSFFRAVTILGDSGLLLPASAALFVLLWAAGSRRAALGFAGALSVCVFVTVTAKLGFRACDTSADALVRSPSGHASLSAMFFASVGLVALRSASAWAGRAVFGLCLALVALVAASRVALHAHTATETLIGLTIGAACFFLFRRFVPARMCLEGRTFALILALFLGIYALLGRSIYLEDWLALVARWIRGQVEC